MISYILALVVGVIVLIADQLSKYYVASNFELGADGITLIPGVLDFMYIHNTGGAWGMLSGHTWFLISITVIVMLICFALLLKVGVKNKLVFWSVSLILFGGIGNMIDRIFRDGNVVDFIQFAFWKDFPIFNIADCVIVIGGMLLIVYFILEFINESRAKKTLSQDNTVKNEHDN